MRVVHETDGDRRVLAADAETAEGFVQTSKGLMFRSSIPDDYALVFEFEPSSLEKAVPFVEASPVARRFIHMLFVRMPLDVLWLRDDTVVQVKTLRPWIGIGGAKADRIIELSAGAADDVEVGDTVVVDR